MTKKRLLIIITIFILSLFFISFITYIIDVNISHNGGEPIFILSKVAADDGGTKVYKGFGYTIIKWRKLAIKQESNKNILHEYLVGVETHYLLNLDSYRNGPAIELHTQ